MRVYPQINTALLGEAAADADASLWVKFPALEDWINGEKKPTVNQLANFAKEVHVPFGYFFLSELPEKENIVPLFRTNSKLAHYDYSYELSQTIDDIQRRQDWLVEFLRGENQDNLPFVGKFDEKSSSKQIVQDIRATLDLPANWSQHLYDKDAAFKYLIQKTEAAGIYVAVNGVLGNSTKNLNPEEFKGFVLSNVLAPYIFINGKDFPAAKAFTLMHELAHIWLGNSSAHDLKHFVPPNTSVEKLCDTVAANLLVDETLLVREWKRNASSTKPLAALERFFKVSQVVIARRLLDVGVFTRERFFAFYNEYKKNWEKKREDASGGDFYSNQTYRVGVKFFQTVNEATASNKLLFTDAYKLTNLYGATFHNFKSKVEGQ